MIKYYCHRCSEILLAERSAYFQRRIMYICHHCKLFHHEEDCESVEAARELMQQYYRAMYPPLIQSTAKQMRHRGRRAARYAKQ